MNFNIRKGDDIYFSLKKSYDCKKYKKFEDFLAFATTNSFIAIDVFINNVNAVNKFHDGDLDISLVNGEIIRLFDKGLREDVAEYYINYDLNNSVIDYLFEEIK